MHGVPPRCEHQFDGLACGDFPGGGNLGMPPGTRCRVRPLGRVQWKTLVRLQLYPQGRTITDLEGLGSRSVLNGALTSLAGKGLAAVTDVAPPVLPGQGGWRYVWTITDAGRERLLAGGRHD